MKRIKVIAGVCGVALRIGERTKIVAKKEKDGFFECSDEQAEHFVSLGVAVYEEDSVETIQEEEHKEELSEMTVKQLKELAKEKGLDVSKIKQKSEIIEALKSGE